MKRAVALTFLFSIGVPSLMGQDYQEHPAVEGFVTRAASPSDFDVNAIPVLCDVHTRSGWSNDDTFVSGCPSTAPLLGEPVTVFGKLDKKRQVIQASRIVQHPLPAPGEMSGSGVIDTAPVRNVPGSSPGTIMVRADGYWILLPFQANITLWGSIKSVEDVSANAWIEYKGRMRPDGVVIATTVKLMSNVPTRSEEKMRKRKTYDPASAEGQKKQTSRNAELQGVDLKRVPPSPDSAMQSRTSSIGEKLVPAYQKTLPSSDPAKLRFRFEVVDSNWGALPVPLADGTILIPRQAVDLMQNDDQLAALLADTIACVLEKQDLRIAAMQYELKTGKVLEYTTDAIAGPGGLAMLGVMRALGADPGSVIHRQMNQSERVSLWLMHDAGYDITQAPRAWWLIAAGKKPIRETRLPDASANLYRLLASTWSQPQGRESGASTTP